MPIGVALTGPLPLHDGSRASALKKNLQMVTSYLNHFASCMCKVMNRYITLKMAARNFCQDALHSLIEFL